MGGEIDGQSGGWKFSISDLFFLCLEIILKIMKRRKKRNSKKYGKRYRVGINKLSPWRSADDPISFRSGLGHMDVLLVISL